MKTERQRGPSIKDFRGALVWGGIAMALGGFLAEQWPIGDVSFGPIMFFGGLLLGLGVMQNYLGRVGASPIGSPDESSDRSD